LGDFGVNRRSKRGTEIGDGMKYLALDFETANNSRQSACSIGLVRVENGIITHKVCHLIKPPTREFLYTHVHGLSWEDVKDAKAFAEIWPEILPLFNGVDFVAAHNAPFDKSVLSSCLEAAALSMPMVGFRCTLKEARMKWVLSGYKLSDVCRHLNIDLNHHEALSDALACAKIILELDKR
jgi:DNA polymerase-3 subunit epsilon